MNRYVEWLAQRKGLNALAVSIYFFVVLFLHDPLVKLSVAVMNFFSRQVYDMIIAGVAFVVLAGIAFFFTKNLTVYPVARRLKVVYLVITLSLIFIHWQTNFVMNIELIHTVEFGILAMLLFPFTRRFGDTAFYTLLLSAADEWFQYTVLYPEKSDYYDFNDLVTNLLGAGFALLILYASGVNNTNFPSRRPIYKSPVAYTLILLTISVFALFQSSLLRVYGGGEGAWAVLNKAEEPESFWRNLPNSEIVYHVMQPMEGAIVLSLLLLLFFLLDFFSRICSGTTTSESCRQEHRLSHVL